MDYIESSDFFHGELRAENVFLTHDLCAKVGNFGFNGQFGKFIGIKPGKMLNYLNVLMLNRRYLANLNCHNCVSSYKILRSFFFLYKLTLYLANYQILLACHSSLTHFDCAIVTDLTRWVVVKSDDSPGYISRRDFVRKRDLHYFYIVWKFSNIQNLLCFSVKRFTPCCYNEMSNVVIIFLKLTR